MGRYTFAVDDCWCVDANNDCYEFDDYYIGDAIEKLAMYENAEAEGRLIILDTPIKEIPMNPCLNCNTGWGKVSENGCDSCQYYCGRFAKYTKGDKEYVELSNK